MVVSSLIRAGKAGIGAAGRATQSTGQVVQTAGKAAVISGLVMRHRVFSLQG